MIAADECLNFEDHLLYVHLEICARALCLNHISIPINAYYGPESDLVEL